MIKRREDEEGEGCYFINRNVDVRRRDICFYGYSAAILLLAILLFCGYSAISYSAIMLFCGYSAIFYSAIMLFCGYSAIFYSAIMLFCGYSAIFYSAISLIEKKMRGEEIYVSFAERG